MVERDIESESSLPLLEKFLISASELTATQTHALGEFVAGLPLKHELLAAIIRKLLESHSENELKSLSSRLLKESLPTDPEFLFTLALACDAIRNNEDGSRCLRKAIELQPDVAMYHNNLGVFLEKMEDFQGAYESYSQAARINPDEALHALNLAKICVNHLNRFQESIRHYNHALALDFENTSVILGSANSYHKMGLYARAANRARLAIKLDPTHIATIFSKLSYFLAICYSSTADLLERRQGLMDELEKIRSEVSIAVETPGYAENEFSVDGWQTLFLLAYQGMNDVEIMKSFSHELARALKPYFPKNIGVPKPHRFEKPPENRRIKVGFCTSFFYHHSIWKIPLHGFYTHLDRSRFEIHSFHMGNQVDFATEEAKQLSESYSRTDSIQTMIELLNQAQLDVLIFPEFGMDVPVFLLSVMRFAPIQCQALGHPTTCGSDTMDFVLSSKLMEPADGQEQYSERLVELPGLGVTYTYPYKFHAGKKHEFGLLETDVVFISPQSTFKYLPENDDIFPRIAAEVDSARFIFIAPSIISEKEKFIERLATSFSAAGLDHRKHVVFLPGQGQAGFMKACNMADLFVDNPSWSGHNTIMDALHSHTQVVTLRGNAMRKNHGTAILTHLDLQEYICESKDDFIRKCIYFSTAQKEKKRFVQAIPGLLKRFHDPAPVRALEDFMSKQLSSDVCHEI